MTHKDYDCDELIRILQEFKAKYPNLRLILEPGSAFTWRTGYLVSTVEDIVENGGVRTAMLDVSFACHMPDCLEMPYKPAILGPAIRNRERRVGVWAATVVWPGITTGIGSSTATCGSAIASCSRI